MKTIKLSLLLLTVFIFSCKKETNYEKELYAIKTDVPIVDKAGGTKVEVGIIIGTMDELVKLSDSSNGQKGMMLQTLSATSLVFGPVPRLLTMKEQCDLEIYNFKLANWHQWQMEADANCKAVQKIVNCSYPYYHYSTPMTYTVYPSFSKCGGTLLHNIDIVKFPFPPGSGNNPGFYDSDMVKFFIQSM